MVVIGQSLGSCRTLLMSPLICTSIVAFPTVWGQNVWLGTLFPRLTARSAVWRWVRCWVCRYCLCKALANGHPLVRQVSSHPQLPHPANHTATNLARSIKTEPGWHTSASNIQQDTCPW
eukprot:COSAG01_NODE_1023_length_12063_cov_25.977432_13_plen_119_part_00